MRKRLKKKKRSCALCKPHKMAKALRWKAADFDMLSHDEKEIRAALRAPQHSIDNQKFWGYDRNYGCRPGIILHDGGDRRRRP